MGKEINYQIYLVTDDYYLKEDGIFAVLEDCLQAGVTVVQYRAKNKSSKEMLEDAMRLKKICTAYQVPLIINDRLDIALAVEADGLHLGQSDLPISVARTWSGNMLVGVSANTYEEGREALLAGADYVGIGPVFATLTKKDAKAPCGLSIIQRLRSEFPLSQLVAIGGIELKNISEINGAGANGVAVVSAILGSQDPKQAVVN